MATRPRVHLSWDLGRFNRHLLVEVLGFHEVLHQSDSHVPAVTVGLAVVQHSRAGILLADHQQSPMPPAAARLLRAVLPSAAAGNAWLARRKPAALPLC